ncbi:AhpC-TSA-domain-containing protein [Mollisia scopiformis]|uniref:thioredoxin-dependent peroxiredoxin n=1 Tax=Mollisia scopiformis TaxID=149040 RepID=A0A194WWP3_MOLSC|nr:AhpC-TSA-domain-containing protein [Mollisia scopiformis]KUJ12002.1 AhpC-TSA-domain-containing protein [Mollisia scopiformis]
MPPELRKRKAPAAEPAAAPPAKKKGPVAKAVAKVKEVIAPKTTKTAAAKTNGDASQKVAVGETIDLEGFGGEIETNDGVKTTLKKLVDESQSGVVLFTYPKASTPGCTNQACMFRDQYTPLTATGFSIYGLSKDSPKANTTFKTKQNLPYPLLCDTSATLISAIGLKKAPANTTRGVFVIDKSGKVLAAEPGSPAGTVEVVKKLVEGGEATTAAPVTEAVEEPKTETTNGVNGTNGLTKEDTDKAEVAAEVADTAEKLDSNDAKPVVA